jgi:uncharacterized coiled-coil DUF342 family protein
MAKITRRMDKLKSKFKKLTKENLALQKAITKKKARLDASQNALRVVEQAIGGKLVEKKHKSTR